MTDREKHAARLIPSSRVERTSRWIGQQSAHCRDCEWQCGNVVTTARQATKHVRATGHAVSVEQFVNYTVRIKEPQ